MKITPIVENKPSIYQPKEAMGSPEKAGQCCHFQSDWHWAVSLHSTVHDSALVANTGSSVTAAVQSKIVWKHEWMIWFTKKVMLKVSDACRSMKRTWDGWTDDRQWDRQNCFWQTIKKHTSLEWKRQEKKISWREWFLTAADVISILSIFHSASTFLQRINCRMTDNIPEKCNGLMCRRQ